MYCVFNTKKPLFILNTNKTYTKEIKVASKTEYRSRADSSHESRLNQGVVYGPFTPRDSECEIFNCSLPSVGVNTVKNWQ